MSESQKWMLLAGVVLGGWLVYQLSPVLTPFLVAAGLAYLGDPIVDRLQRRRLSRTAAVVVVFAVMVLAGLGLLLVFVPMLKRQAVVLASMAPAAVNWFETALLPRIASLPGVGEIRIDADAVRSAMQSHGEQIGGIVTRVLGNVFQSGQVVIGWLTFLFLTPVVTFYLLRDWDDLVASLRELVPRGWEAGVVGVVGECDAVLAQFLRGQLLVMLALALVYTTGLWLAGLDLAFLIGVIAGLVSFIPYMGVIVGLTLAGIAALIQYHDVIHLVWVVAVFVVGQLLEGMILSPLLVGDRIGLHPVAVIFAVMAGGQLAGFVGVLLALPAAAVVVVLLRHAHARYVASDFYTP
ncbi:MAG: AI-2E family transporter [Gammaproteobacteria bacterium]